MWTELLQEPSLVQTSVYKSSIKLCIRKTIEYLVLFSSLRFWAPLVNWLFNWKASGTRGTFVEYLGFIMLNIFDSKVVGSCESLGARSAERSRRRCLTINAIS